jgi:hypothetical protein
MSLEVGKWITKTFDFFCKSFESSNNSSKTGVYGQKNKRMLS